MSKKKLDIIELNLGEDVSDLTATPPINSETQENINKKIRLAKQETDAIQRVKNKRNEQQKQKEDIINTCFKLLLETTENDGKISADKIKEIIGEMNLSSVILMIKNLIKKRGNLWHIKKFTKNKKNYYKFIAR